MKIIYLPTAELSLDEIFHFISSENEKAAINVYNNILDEIDKLSLFPQMGKCHSSIIGIRTFVITKNYKAIYFIDSDTIYIALVWDCRQDPKDFKKKILDSLKY